VGKQKGRRKILELLVKGREEVRGEGRFRNWRRAVKVEKKLILRKRGRKAHLFQRNPEEKGEGNGGESYKVNVRGR